MFVSQHQLLQLNIHSGDQMTSKALYLTRTFARFALVYLVTASTIFVGLPASAQGPQADSILLESVATSTVSKMSVGDFGELSTAATGPDSMTTAAAPAAGATTYHALNVEFRTAAARKALFTDQKTSLLPGATVITVIDRFADIFIQSDAPWNALEANPNVLRVEYSAKVEAPPPPDVTPAPLTSQAVPETIIRGGYQGLNGKNVIIAVLDTGIDFRHPDFITYNSAGLPTSRIAYLWDTATPFQRGRGNQAPFKFPNGTSIGTLYTQAQLTAELRAKSPTMPPTDLDGHGTACASVAAGNGNADRVATGLKRTDVVGVAPEATIIGIRMGYDGLENSYLLNAMAEWLDSVAKTTPMVISGSFGGQYSGHDGQRIMERQLDARFPLGRPGRAVVFAAGNEGNDRIHAKVNFTNTEKAITWNARQQTLVKMYFNSAEKTISAIGSPTTPLGKNLRVSLNPITSQLEAQLTVNPGPGGIKFVNSSGKPVEAHLYFMSRSYGNFDLGSASQTHLVGSPGAMTNAITVGSYDWNDNFHSGGKNVTLSTVCVDDKGARFPFEVSWLSCYSSPGPLRNGVVKPEIVAPGQWYQSASAKKEGGLPAGSHFRLDSTGNYRAMNGTSAATPYTSGIIALMFQKKPALTLGQVRDHLKAHASKTGLNPLGSAIPNNNWGYGKLDNAAIGRIFGAL